ncbi:acyl-CoA dehydrogenase family protein [Muricoccus radiodurans]|uniref:acyl-CoA dehydrogenase family protein n=1 Tax=Muricoccus radiodurans TaxID=2231721 RepID=UPI003CE75D02
MDGMTLSAEDRRILADNVERYAARAYPFAHRAAVLRGAEGFDCAVWEEMAGLGLLGLGLPEASGGTGGSLRDLGIALQAIGRHLMMEPFLGTAAVCAPLVAALDPDGAVLDLAPVVEGRVILALAHGEPQLGLARGPITTRAAGGGKDGRLTGRKGFVLDGPVADHLLVTASEEGGTLGVYLVDPAAAGLTMTAAHSVDGRRIAELVLEEVPARRLSTSDAAPAIGRALDRGAVAAGFEAAGSMRLLVEVTAEHLRTRRAFGRTLSKFQVLQHRMVDMHILAEETLAVVEAAADAADAGAPEAPRLAAIAKVHASRAARAVAEGAVQLHGGIGVTDELAVSHHFRRLMMLEALFGDAEHHLERLVAMGRAPSPEPAR